MSQPWLNPQREYVSRMFGAIADHYDLMNWIMTLGQDQRWRRQAVDVSAIAPGDSALDVATGTGDLAFELARRVGSGGHVLGLDFAEPMLDIARKKARRKGMSVSFESGDALSLPYGDASFQAITCGFGLRNMDDRARALAEMARVARPGGRVVILELTPPRNALASDNLQCSTKHRHNQRARPDDTPGATFSPSQNQAQSGEDKHQPAKRQIRRRHAQRQQLPPLRAIKSAKRFVQQSETHSVSHQRASQSDALAFSTRNQAAALSEFCLQSVGQLFEQLPKLGLFQQVRCRHTVRVAVAEIRKQRTIP